VEHTDVGCGVGVNANVRKCGEWCPLSIAGQRAGKPAPFLNHVWDESIQDVDKKTTITTCFAIGKEFLPGRPGAVPHNRMSNVEFRYFWGFDSG
jgi:hypothetical protein